MYHLYLLRHGKSDWTENTDDFHRPLNDRGKRAAQRIGVWMAKNELNPEYVISSPAERTKVTAQKMLKAKDQGEQKIVFDERIYMAEERDLFALLKEIPEKTKSVLLVAHNPAIEMLFLTLQNKKMKYLNSGKIFPTATLAHLTLSKSWSKIKPGGAQLEHIIYPKSLPKTFPFPSPFGKEQRIRPAYYYQQSSVIPYRYKNGKLQILIISSSKNKHFVIPKGIIEPGLTAQQSAAKEALEEAGAKGIVSKKATGSYDYTKWESNCHVDVFPMQVTELLDKVDWAEKHRGRQWMSVENAANIVRQTELKPILLKLPQNLKKDK
jgi:phosphohistidine phosphatase